MNTFILLCRVDKLRLETLFEINPYFEQTKLLKNARIDFQSIGDSFTVSLNSRS